MDAFWLVTALSQEQGATAGYASAVDFEIIALVSIMIFVDYGVHCSLVISIAWFECAGKKRSFDRERKIRSSRSLVTVTSIDSCHLS
jgi:hypothetical protein